MEVTTRLYSIVTGNDNLEFLYQLKKFQYSWDVHLNLKKKIYLQI